MVKIWTVWGWDIASTQDFFKCYDDDYIKHKVKETSETIPSHYFIHGQMGLSALATYYKDTMNDVVIYNLLLRLESKIANRDLENIPFLARQLLKFLYEK